MWVRILLTHHNLKMMYDGAFQFTIYQLPTVSLNLFQLVVVVIVVGVPERGERDGDREEVPVERQRRQQRRPGESASRRLRTRRLSVTLIWVLCHLGDSMNE